MANNVSWDNVPTQLIQIIGSKIGSLHDFIRFSAVSKTWKSVISERREADKALILLSPEAPMLILAEEVQGTLLGCDICNDEDEDGLEEDVDDEMEDSEEEEEESEEKNDEEEEESKENDEEVEEEKENEEDNEEVKESDEEDEEEDGEDVDDEMEESEEEEEESEENDVEEEESEEDEEEVEEESEVEDEEQDGEDYGVEDQVEGLDEDMEVDHEEGLDDDMEGDPEKRGDEDMGLGQGLRYESVGSARGMFSLSTRKLYTIELPEAAGKVIMAISKGWVLTLGKDFQTNLLHPLLRQEISLPTTRVIRAGNEYSSFEGVFTHYVRKAAMSSEVQGNENVLRYDRPNPTIMMIYGGQGYLGFTRPGDKVWTKVDVPCAGFFVDIAYHRGKFYSVNCVGDTFVCHIDDDYTNGRHANGTQIAKCPFIDPAERTFEGKYLVDSGWDLWLLVRLREVKHFKPPNHMRVKYRTTSFLVWKLEKGVSEDGLQHTWIQRKNLDNMAFFVGRNSSVALPYLSGCISPNSIYFTDDAGDLYFLHGGGHDVGVYYVEREIVSHVQGRSIHPFSPPFWYI